jgi:hypothetical protein
MVRVFLFLVLSFGSASAMAGGHGGIVWKANETSTTATPRDVPVSPK